MRPFPSVWSFKNDGSTNGSFHFKDLHLKNKSLLFVSLCCFFRPMKCPVSKYSGSTRHCFTPTQSTFRTNCSKPLFHLRNASNGQYRVAISTILKISLLINTRCESCCFFICVFYFCWCWWSIDVVD